MPHCIGFSAWIAVGGAEAPEYWGSPSSSLKTKNYSTLSVCVQFTFKYRPLDMLQGIAPLPRKRRKAPAERPTRAQTSGEGLPALSSRPGWCYWLTLPKKSAP
ncbi:hypothetical protein FB451DRAFT_1420157 [Mycena latifolia]|nr:hypothetical protein FB451DRAFT_1420157 [Mycena latifolia]